MYGRNRPRGRFFRSASILALVLLSLTPSISGAQTASIGIYNDEARSSCSLSDAGGGMVRAYVFVASQSGFTGVRFSAPKPACFNAVWVGDETNFISIGDSQTDISVALGGCQGAQLVMSMLFQVTSATAPCCPFTIQPAVGQPEIEYTDCAFVQYALTPTISHVNGNETCPCENGIDFPPTTPHNESPASGTVNLPVTLPLAWESSDPEGGTLKFDLYLGAAADPPLYQSDLAQRTVTVGPLAYATTYHWKIVAKDGAGNSAAGPVWNFTTTVPPPPPAEPVNPTPANGAVNQVRALTLQWNYSGAGPVANYEVHFGTTATPPVVATLPFQAGSGYAVDNLALNTLYYWSVVAIGPGGARTPGALWSFRTVTTNPPPDAPTSPSPADHATQQPVNLTLHWAASDPESQPLQYNVYFGTSSNPPFRAHASVASQAISALAFDTNYYWRVVAVDPDSAKTSGPVWTFHTVRPTFPPDPPSHPSPADGATGVSLLSPLTWHAHDPDGQPMHYALMIAKTPTCYGSIVLNDTILIPDTPYEPNTKYYWSVTAYDADENATLGPTWSFTTGDGTVASGDVNNDGNLTIADAQCALESYLYAPIIPPNCGGAGVSARGDVDCSATTTPRDADCIFRKWLDGSCSFCNGSGSAVASGAFRPGLSLRVLRENDDIVVILHASSAASISAFGFDLQYPGGLELERVEPGRDDIFAALQMRVSEPGHARVGAYATPGRELPGNGDILAIRFGTGANDTHGTVTLQKFVDDLAESAPVSVALETSAPLPNQVVLHQNSPNPFNPETMIRFELPQAMRVSLAVFDVNGRLVKQLLDEHRDAGTSTVEWNGTDAQGRTVATGVYFCVLDAGGARYQHKMVLLK